MNKKIRMGLVLICIVVMIASLVGCKKKEDPVELPYLYTTVIYAGFSNGSVDPEVNDLIKEDVFEITTQPTIEDLASALTEWTGLDFNLKGFRIEGKNAYVDWAINSTLVAGLDDIEQKEEFTFYDNTSLNWFMMDSLASTIKGNFPVEVIYYSQGGGKPLAFEDGQGIDLDELPVKQSYEGSAFFVTHSDGKGDPGNTTDSKGSDSGDTDGSNKSDPGDTNGHQWKGTWMGDGFSIITTEFDGNSF